MKYRKLFCMTWTSLSGGAANKQSISSNTAKLCRVQFKSWMYSVKFSFNSTFQPLFQVGLGHGFVLVQIDVSNWN